MWRAARGAGFDASRFASVADALRAVDVDPVPVAYDEAFADEVRALLADIDGVLVWIDPLHDGKTRVAVDALLRDIAARGSWVSAHPDTIDKMGVKDVLVRTRQLGWGSDVYLYGSYKQFCDEFPTRLRSSGPRVLKPSRGNRGQRVWKVEAGEQPDRVAVLEAVRGSAPASLSLSELLARCAGYFVGGALVDQAYQPRLADGMTRCYLAGDRVVGFGTQHVSQLLPTMPDTPKVMHPADAGPFQTLRRTMEASWVPEMMRVLDLEQRELPILWDADFFGASHAANDPYTLCEINVSSVVPFPDGAPAAIAALVKERL
jgi:hypothetical protein